MKELEHLSSKDLDRLLNSGKEEAPSIAPVVIPEHSELPTPEQKDPGLVHDLLLNAGQGATLGFGDEILGGVQALANTASGKSKLENLLDTYRKYQKENEKGVEESLQRHPVLGTGAQLAGGLLIPGAGTLGAIGEGATALQAAKTGAKAGAVMGGLAGIGGSKETLGNIPGLLEEGAKGAGIGALTGGALSGISRGIGNYASKVVSDSPELERDVTAFREGLAGNKTSGKTGPQTILADIRDKVNSASEQILKPAKQAAEEYGKAVESATGTLTGDNLDNFTNTLIDNIDVLPTKFKPKQTEDGEFIVRGLPELENILNGNGTARDLKTLQIKLRDQLGSMEYGDANKGKLKQILEETSNGLQSLIPPEKLAELNQKYSGAFSIPEQLLGKKLSGISYNDRAPEVQDALNQLVGKVGYGNVPGHEARQTLNDIIKTGVDFANKNPEYQFDSKGVNDLISQAGRKMAAIGASSGLSGKLGAETGKVNPFEAVANLSSNRAGFANTIGRIASSPVSPYGMATAAEPTLLSAANTLKNVPGLSKLGQTLEDSINNKSSVAKNAAMMAIMQNPAARKALGVNIKEQEHEEGTK
jgi:hypothetical protein